MDFGRLDVVRLPDDDMRHVRTGRRDQSSQRVVGVNSSHRLGRSVKPLTFTQIVVLAVSLCGSDVQIRHGQKSGIS
jgi:hypothetical protein